MNRKRFNVSEANKSTIQQVNVSAANKPTILRFNTRAASSTHRLTALPNNRITASPNNRITASQPMKTLLFILIALIAASCNQPSTFHTDSGKVFGTYYRIVYQSNTPLHDGIKSSLKQVNASLSTFDSTSIISRINQNDTTVVADSLFALVFNTAQQVSMQTHGAFDITVAPLVNAWGFGFDPTRNRTQATIDSLKACVGYSKIALQKGKIIKTVPCVQLDASAIAKGLGCDVVAHYLESQGVGHYLVDIGGEMRLKGFNAQGKEWRVGIQQPKEDSLLVSNQIAAILQTSNVGIATSGNYRQFYYQDGQKISHTIDPRTGYPTAHNLLSTTVIAPSAMLADAYATAFMVLGDKDSIEAIAQSQQLAVYLLYASHDSIQASYNALFETYLVP